MKHLSISIKLILTIGTAVIAGAILVVILLSQLDSMATTHAGVMASEVHQIDSARVIQVEFKKQVQEWKDILLRGKDPEALRKHTDKFTAQDHAVGEKAQTLIRDIGTATIRDRVAQFATNHREMSAKYHVALQTFVNDPAKDPAAADKMVKGLDRAATDAIDGVVAELNTRIAALTTANTAHVAADRQKVITVALIVLALVLGFSTMIARDIVGAQRAIVRGLESIAAGELGTRLDDSRRDEMGKIVVALNAAIESWRRKDQETATATVAREREQTEGLQTGFQTILTAVSAAKAGDLTRDIDTRGKPPIVTEVGGLLGEFIESLRTRISTIDQHAGQLAAASEELSTTAQDLSAASVQTATQTGAAQTTVAEMGTSVTTVSASASQMTDAIRDITVNAQQACKVASEAVVMVEDANQTMARLGTSSKEIGEVVKVITSIAAQTNLLALNATIEAARAGEAGRGFAIVAREVKDLAAETAKATENIDQRIRAIQTDTLRAVKAIASVKTVIENVNNFSSTIAAAVEEHTSITTEVRRTLTWVADGTSKLGGNVSSVSQAAEATTSGARNTQGAADAIATMASEMKSLVSQFRLVKHPGEGRRVQELRVPVAHASNGSGTSIGSSNGYATARRAS